MLKKKKKTKGANSLKHIQAKVTEYLWLDDFLPC